MRYLLLVLLLCTNLFAKIIVDNPNDGDRWKWWTQVLISWFCDEGQTIRIEIALTTDAGSTWTVIDTVSNYHSSYYLFLGEKYRNYCSDYCKIRLTTESNSSDHNWGYFTIYADPSITITKPDGGEHYSKGQILGIYWKSTGPIEFVKILLSTDNKSTWKVLSSKTANDGNENYPVPSGVNSDRCYIRIWDYDQKYYDDSNNSFTIDSYTNLKSTTWGKIKKLYK